MLDNKASRLFLPFAGAQANRTVRPYARKDDETAMQAVTPVQIYQGTNTTTPWPACDFNHGVPAVIFSSGGFTGNLFHEFNEAVIPLFITCRHFRSRLKFVITDFKPWWAAKYNRILSHLSGYDVINPAENGSVHCFPGAVVGLKYHGNLALNSTDIPGGYSMFEFRHFLRQVYNLKVTNVSKTKKPVLILVSRSKSRKFLNEDEMGEMMGELGFEVIVVTPYRMANLDKFSGLLNSCSVLVGAHGAGLTNAVFLPSGAVVVQVVPLGLDWAANAYYRGPATEMGLKYLEYKVSPDESSLLAAYGSDHPVITDPESILSKGYEAARAVYVDEQNLKINLVRFRETMTRAMELLGRSTPLK